MLIEKGADPNVADETGRAALYAATEMNTLEFTHGRPAPKKTSTLGPMDVAKLLLSHGANPNQTLKTPVLRRHNSPGNQFLGNGSTPLMRAARGGDVALMRLLIDNGADPKITQKNNTTLLMLAAGLVTMLLYVSFDLDRPTRGLITVPNGPLVSLRASMIPPPAASGPAQP